MKQKLLYRVVEAALAASLLVAALVAPPARPALADGDLAYHIEACLNGYTLTLPQQGYLSGPPGVYFGAIATVTSITLPGTNVSVEVASFHANSKVGYWTTPQTSPGALVTFTVQQTGYYMVNGTNTANKMYSLTNSNSYPIQDCHVLYPWETVPKPAGPLNLQHGSLISQLTPGLDGQGNPDLQVWCVDSSGKGYFGGAVTGADIDGASALPGLKTLVRRIDTCLAPVSFYVAPDGEYQVDIGPDGEGKIYTVNFLGLPPTHVYFDGNQPGEPGHNKPHCTPNPYGGCY